MFPPMWIQLPCMNIDVNTPSYQGTWCTATAGATHGPVQRARVVAVVEDVGVDRRAGHLPDPDDERSQRSARP